MLHDICMIYSKTFYLEDTTSQTVCISELSEKFYEFNFLNSHYESLCTTRENFYGVLTSSPL